MSDPIDLTRGAPFPITLEGAPEHMALREVPEGFELRHACLSGGPDAPERHRIITAPSICIGQDHHTLVSRTPLTIQPSVACPSCGLHGFITAGRWVPA